MSYDFLDAVRQFRTDNSSKGGLTQFFEDTLKSAKMQIAPDDIGDILRSRGQRTGEDLPECDFCYKKATHVEQVMLVCERPECKEKAQRRHPTTNTQGEENTHE